MKKLQIAKNHFLSDRRSYISIIFFVGLLCFSALIFLIGGNSGDLTSLFKVEAAQNAVTGEWTAQINGKRASEIHLMFLRRSSKNGSGSLGTTFPLKELQGLTPEAISSAKRDVNFRIVSEAGTFEFEGYFREGRGAGFWKLIPNQNFISVMRSHGYDNLSDEKLFMAAIGNLTVKLVEELKSAGYDRLSFDDLVEAALFDVTTEFIRTWRAAGFDNLSFDDFVELGTHDVTPEFLNEIKSEGFPRISVSQAVELKIHDIDRDFIRRVKAKGFPNVTLDELVELRIHKIVK